MGNDPDANEKIELDSLIEKPHRISVNDYDDENFDAFFGMGMGMGMYPPSNRASGREDLVDSALGGSLLARHDWKQHVYLAEFLKYLGEKEKFSVFENSIDAIPINISEIEYQEKKDIPAALSSYTRVGDASNQIFGLSEFDDIKFETKRHEEIKVLHEFEGARDSERVAEIISESSEFVPQFENLCYFDGHSHPNTYQLVETMVLIGYTVAMYFKERYSRKRPSVVDPGLSPAIKVPTFKAFPSGHSTQVHLIRCLFTHNQREMGLSDALVGEIEDLARSIARNREFAGVHYYTDSLAGEVLAEEIWASFVEMINKVYSNGFVSAIRKEKDLISRACSEWVS